MSRKVFVLLVAAFSAIAVCAADSAFQQAESVWGEGRGSTNAYLKFSAAFDAAKVQRTGEPPVLRIAAATVYRAKLNGAYVGYGPARTAEGWAKVDEWPLDDVREGRNEIEIDVAGYVCESYQYVIQPAFLRAEVVQNGKVLAATVRRLAEDGLPYQTFTATEIARDIGGAVYSRQRGFPGERYVVDPDAKPVAVPLVKAADVKLRPRAVPYPEFKVKDDFTETKAGPGKVWSAPFNDTGFIGFKVKVTEPGTFAVRFDEGLEDGKTLDGVTAGRYFTVKRDWKLGDIMEVKFDMPVVAHSLGHHVAFTRGPVLLARDSCFADGDLTEPFRSGIKDGQTMPTFAAVRTPSDDVWMAFSATLPIGSHTENPEANNPSTVFFCDYASAGNTWTRANFYRTWFPIEYGPQE